MNRLITNAAIGRLVVVFLALMVAGCEQQGREGKECPSHLSHLGAKGVGAEEEELTDFVRTELQYYEEKMTDLKKYVEGEGEYKSFRELEFNFDKKLSGAKALLFRVTSAGTGKSPRVQVLLRGALNAVKRAYEDATRRWKPLPVQTESTF